ncbi:hypothetical protein OHA17_08110 [Streptomyces sp. NBC_00212]
MSDAVDADELLRRIRHARDWALAQEDKCRAKTEAAEDAGERLFLQDQARVLNTVRAVLDEIVEPGKHEGE